MIAGYYDAAIRFQLRSPFLTAGLEARRFGVDASQLRDPEGRAVLPAGLVRGTIRHALMSMMAAQVNVAEVLALFGDEGDELENAGSIRVRDCIAQCEGQGGQVTTRIALGEETGAVREGALLVVELSHPVGSEVTFIGSMGFPAKDAATAEAIVETLNKAVGQIAAVGAFKSVGFGRVVDAAVAEPKLSVAFEPEAVEPGGRAYSLAFSLDGPLLVDTEYVERNVLQGAKRISGAVLKGALARRLADAGIPADGALNEALTKTVFGFADAQPPLAPMTMLQCYAVDGHASRADASGLDPRDPNLRIGGHVAAFASDWKVAHWREGEEPQASGLRYETRTRLAISQETGAAKPGALFSQRALPANGAVWNAKVLWPGGDDEKPPPEFYRLLGHLKSGLFSIGRLKAGMKDVKLRSLAEPSEIAIPEGPVAVVLATPHMMLRAADLADEETLVAGVERFFAAASGGAWRVARDNSGDPRIFACQELRGDFQAARFKPFGENRIEPFVLMIAGSVFVLERAEQSEAADIVLRDWLQLGLPEPVWDGVELNYLTCPFLRSNGLGAISIARPGATLPDREGTS